MINEQIKDLQALEIKDKLLVWRPYMEKYNCQTVMEIGVREGKNFKGFVEHNPLRAVAIDCWRNDGNMARNDKDYGQLELDKQYINFVTNTIDNPYVEVYRSYSSEAVKLFLDETFDIIYIDADHTFEGCLQDIVNYYPKVKEGGVLVGDDYRRHKTRTGVKIGVIKAIQTFVKRNNLQDKFFEMPKSTWGLLKD